MALLCAARDVTRQPERSGKNRPADHERNEPLIPTQDVGKYHNIQSEAANNKQPAEKLQPRGLQGMYAALFSGITVIRGYLIQGAIEFIPEIAPGNLVFAAFKETFKKPFFIIVKIMRIRLYTLDSVRSVCQLNEQGDYVFFRQLSFIPIRYVCTVHALGRIKFNGLNDLLFPAVFEPYDKYKNKARKRNKRHGAEL